MRKWGILISVFYALIVICLLLPASIYLAGADTKLPAIVTDVGKAAGEGLLWLPLLAVLIGQALLLFLSVDTSQNRLKPRAHILVSVAITAMLLGLLTAAIVLSAGLAFNEKFLDTHFETITSLVLFWLLLWAIWGALFYWYARNSSAVVSRAISWLLAGSVLELLIAVPCHVIVRRRNDCSAPIITSFGIVTGIAIMLLSFGPSVLVLYKKRLDSYKPPSHA